MLTCSQSVSQSVTKRGDNACTHLRVDEVLAVQLALAGGGVTCDARTCALMRYSPYSLRSPVEGLRVKHTPVPLVGPMLPYAMACTFTAVPCGWRGKWRSDEWPGAIAIVWLLVFECS